MAERCSEGAVREAGRFFPPDRRRSLLTGRIESMKKTVSIKENTDFRRLYYRGKNVANEYLAVYSRRCGGRLCRLGITVSAKVGKAVVRNRVRRLIRESYRLMEDEVRKSMDIVIVARSSAAGADFSAVRASLEEAFLRAGLIKGARDGAERSEKKGGRESGR